MMHKKVILIKANLLHITEFHIKFTHMSCLPEIGPCRAGYVVIQTVDTFAEIGKHDF